MRKIKKKASTPVNVLILTAILCLFGIFGIAIGASAFSLLKFGEHAPKVGFGSVTCKNWEDSGDRKTLFEEVANDPKFQIQPALLGAVFLEENGGNWKTDTETWPTSSAGAQGPFQFMPATWDGYGMGGNVNDLEDAARGAANYLSQLLKNTIHTETNTSSDVDIKSVAVAYNGGPGYYQTWRDANYDDSKLDARYIDYKDKVLEYFNDLNSGCSSSTGVDVASTGSFDTSFMAQEPLKGWLAKRKNDQSKKLQPSGIVLHYTGRWEAEGAAGVQDLIGAWFGRSDGPTINHLVIDREGKVYQLIPFDIKQSGSGIAENAKGDNANAFAIGIEIAGSSEEGLSTNQTQLNAVIATIKTLEASLNIQNVAGNRINFDAERGIFGHFQTQGGGVPGCNGSRGHNDPGTGYMQKIWDSLESEGTGCI